MYILLGNIVGLGFISNGLCVFHGGYLTAIEGVVQCSCTGYILFSKVLFF